MPRGLCPTQPQALARGVRASGRSPRGARLQSRRRRTRCVLNERNRVICPVMDRLRLIARLNAFVELVETGTQLGNPWSAEKKALTRQMEESDPNIRTILNQVRPGLVLVTIEGPPSLAGLPPRQQHNRELGFCESRMSCALCWSPTRRPSLPVSCILGCGRRHSHFGRRNTTPRPSNTLGSRSTRISSRRLGDEMSPTMIL